MGVNFNFLCPLTLAWSPPHTHMHTHTQLQTNLQTHTHTHAHAHAHSHSHSHTHPSYLLCIASYTHWFWCVCDEVKWKLWAFYFFPSLTLSYTTIHTHPLTPTHTLSHAHMHTLTLGFHGGQKVSFVLYSWSFSRWRKKSWLNPLHSELQKKPKLENLVPMIEKLTFNSVKKNFLKKTFFANFFEFSPSWTSS